MTIQGTRPVYLMRTLYVRQNTSAQDGVMIFDGHLRLRELIPPKSFVEGTLNSNNNVHVEHLKGGENRLKKATQFGVLLMLIRVPNGAFQPWGGHLVSSVHYVFAPRFRSAISEYSPSNNKQFTSPLPFHAFRYGTHPSTAAPLPLPGFQSTIYTFLTPVGHSIAPQPLAVCMCVCQKCCPRRNLKASSLGSSLLCCRKQLVVRR